MNIKLIIKKILFNLGLNIETLNSKEDVRYFIKEFRNKYQSIDLIRIGGNGDGGYLVPDILKNIKYCFSAGVGDVSNFEKELSEKYNIKSFMADASVNNPPIEDKNFFFIKKYLGSKNENNIITLKDWVSQNLNIDDKGEKILQMDIEGSEYEVLTYESADILSKFTIIVIEFHSLQNLVNKNFFKVINAIFQKLYLNFSICHVHPNNFSGLYSFGNIDIPSSIEITFLRNDNIEKIKSLSEIKLPHRLDCRTVDHTPEISMPEIWWKQ